MSALRDGVARALYDHEIDTYDADPTNREAFWLDPDVRSFWLARADVVLTTLAGLGVPVYRWGAP